MKWNYYCYSETGGREENEDTAGVRVYGNTLVAIVADGLGGQGDGRIASQTVFDSLIHCGEDGRLPTEGILKTHFELANNSVILRQENSFHMKSTAVYLALWGGNVIWAHIGDSRLYHIWKNRICDYTLDHSASQMAVMLGQITRDEIPGDAGRSRLIRAMGVPNEIPDIHPMVRLEPGLHGFLLCSDGLWEYLTDAKIETYFSRAANAEEFVRMLRAERDKNAPEDCDNNSAVAVFVEV